MANRRSMGDALSSDKLAFIHEGPVPTTKPARPAKSAEPAPKSVGRDEGERRARREGTETGPATK